MIDNHEQNFSLTVLWRARPLENVLGGIPRRRRLRFPYGAGAEYCPLRKPLLPPLRIEFCGYYVQEEWSRRKNIAFRDLPVRRAKLLLMEGWPPLLL